MHRIKVSLFLWHDVEKVWIGAALPLVATPVPSLSFSALITMLRMHQLKCQNQQQKNLKKQNSHKSPIFPPEFQKFPPDLHKFRGISADNSTRNNSGECWKGRLSAKLSVLSCRSFCVYRAHSEQRQPIICVDSISHISTHSKMELCVVSVLALLQLWVRQRHVHDIARWTAVDASVASLRLVSLGATSDWWRHFFFPLKWRSF